MITVMTMYVRVGLLGGHAADLGLHNEGGTVGQRVHAHRGHADDLVERLGIDGAQGHELVGHGAAEDLGAAEGGAGNTGKYVGR